jgi:hypothetical protein
MSESGERERAKAKDDTREGGATPRPEGRVRERGWRPTTRPAEFVASVKVAARRRAIEAADSATVLVPEWVRRPQLSSSDARERRRFGIAGGDRRAG